MKKKPTRAELPELPQLKAELKREMYKARYQSVFRSTVFTLVVVAAMAVLVATLLLPVLQIYGTSMSPTLSEGDIVVSIKSPHINRGDIIAFYYNNKLLVKRVVAMSGDVVDIDEDGNVTLNGEPLDEPYLSEKSLGDCNITLPYKVPDERYFMMGDHRENSLDSRNSAIGCVSKDQIVGKLVFSVWPLKNFGKIGL